MTRIIPERYYSLQDIVDNKWLYDYTKRGTQRRTAYLRILSFTRDGRLPTKEWAVNIGAGKHRLAVKGQDLIDFRNEYGYLCD